MSGHSHTTSINVKEKKSAAYVLLELMHHLPYSIFGVTISLLLMGLMTFLAILIQSEGLLPQASSELFHVFHPAHVLFSAVASTAMFWKHEKNLIKAILIGLLGSITICGLSDIIFPLVGGFILGSDMHMHVCIIEAPFSIIPFAIVGVLAGLAATESFERSTEYSHSAHVFISSVASILYLIGYGVHDWIHVIGGVFLVTIIAVMIPCCASDIIFPIACLHKNCAHD